MSDVSSTSRDDLLCFSNGRDKLRLSYKLLDWWPLNNLAVNLLGRLYQLLDSNNDLDSLATLHINIPPYSTNREQVRLEKRCIIIANIATKIRARQTAGKL